MERNTVRHCIKLLGMMYKISGYIQSLQIFHHKSSKDLFYLNWFISIYLYNRYYKKEIIISIATLKYMVKSNNSFYIL